MPLLRHEGSDRQEVLVSGMLVGRSPRCGLRLVHPQVSAEHASLRWTAEGWEVRDLHSRNGTIVDGRPATPGEWTAVRRGSVIQFASSETWILADDSPPKLTAVRESDGTAITSEHSLLAIPSDEDPQVIVFADSEGRWRAESDGHTRPIVHGDAIPVDRERWYVYVPDGVSRTVDATGTFVTVQDVELHFAISRDEEHLGLSARVGGRAVDCKSYAFHHVTLTLARIRERDRDRSALPEAEQGWVYVDELRRMMGMTRSQLNLAIHRMRRQLAEAGLLDAANLVERRPDTGQMRLGVSRFHIESP